jgi:hypothetical protein
MTTRSKHASAKAATGNARAGSDLALKPLALALTEGAICHPACPHLWSTLEGDPRCGAFVAALHPSFEAEPIAVIPRAERCTDCLVAEDLFGGTK